MDVGTMDGGTNNVFFQFRGTAENDDLFGNRLARFLSYVGVVKMEDKISELKQRILSSLVEYERLSNWNSHETFLPLGYPELRKRYKTRPILHSFVNNLFFFVKENFDVKNK